LSQIFIELYLDEDVDVLIAELLRGRGFSVTNTRDAGQLGCTDDEQLAYAARERKTLVTHNRAHFEALAREYLSTWTKGGRIRASSWPGGTLPTKSSDGCS
jgi:hypothetical protein